MVEVLYYEAANKNKTIGYVDVRVPILKPTVLIFRRISHIQSGDRRWFNLSTFSRDNPDGSPNYLKFCEFETQAYNSQLLESLSEKVKEYCAMNGIKELEPMNFNDFPASSSDEQLPF